MMQCNSHDTVWLPLSGSCEDVSISRGDIAACGPAADRAAGMRSAPATNAVTIGRLMRLERHRRIETNDGSSRHRSRDALIECCASPQNRIRKDCDVMRASLIIPAVK
jgi:hypothetical protein